MLFSYFCTPLAEKKPGEIRSECKYTERVKRYSNGSKIVLKRFVNPPNEKTQFFGVLKCKHVTNLYSHMAQ